MFSWRWTNAVYFIEKKCRNNYDSNAIHWGEYNLYMEDMIPRKKTLREITLIKFALILLGNLSVSVRNLMLVHICANVVEVGPALIQHQAACAGNSFLTRRKI